MKPVVTLYATQPVPFVLRSIKEDDIQLLRQWKNDHREFFFYKQIITAEQQKEWFTRWSAETCDHLFVVEVDGVRIGCIGIRLLEKSADVYNVILGDKAFGGRGVMSESLRAVVAFSQFLYSGLPVCVRVLQTNPAVGWYERNGFARITANDEYVTMKWAQPILSHFQCNMTLTIPCQQD